MAHVSLVDGCSTHAFLPRRGWNIGLDEVNVKNGEVEDMYGLLIGLLDRVSDITTIFPGEYTTFTVYRIDLDNENALNVVLLRSLLLVSGSFSSQLFC